MELPVEFKKRMTEMLGTESEAFFDAFSSDEVETAVRINPKKPIPDGLKEILASKEKVEWCELGYYINKDILSGNHPYHLGGLLYFQEPSAMAVVSALDISEDDYVLDLCAAPGGKATHAAGYLGDGGILVANEIVKKRSMILADNIERMGIKNAVVTNESPKNLEKHFPQFFSKIIVDAPCSGEGMFRKEPRAIEEWSIAHTEACAERQKLILDSAISMLAPGGELIYSTCTFAPAENEGIVEYILNKYPDMSLLPINLSGLTPADAKYIGSDKDYSSAKRIFPHLSRGEGHFLALFKKEGTFIKPSKHQTKKSIPEESLYRDFEKKYLNVRLSGNFELFGENLYLVPDAISTDKLKLERAGLFLGKCKKGRFEPSHALSLALGVGNFKNTYEPEDIEKYLKGETYLADIDGWCAVVYDKIPLGWAKGSQGVLKNHFPKFLRIF